MQFWAVLISFWADEYPLWRFYAQIRSDDSVDCGRSQRVVLRLPSGNSGEYDEIERSEPNPFKDRTSIKYKLPEGRNVHTEIYSLLGQKVRTRVNGEQDAGPHTVSWDATDNSLRKVASGTYFLRLEAGQYSATSKVCVVR